MATKRPPRLLKINEAADAFRVDRKTVYKLIHAGSLRLVKLGASSRIRESDVTALIEGGTR